MSRRPGATPPEQPERIAALIAEIVLQQALTTVAVSEVEHELWAART